MKRFSICVTSDVHGYIMPNNYRNQQEEAMGLAKTASIIKEIRKNNHTILIDNGDFIQGSPFTYYFAKKVSDRPSPMMKAANLLGYDAAIIGNHEFNYGMPYLHHTIEASNFPWLSANIIRNATGKPVFGQPYIIKEIANVRVAILGTTTHYIPNWEDPKTIDGLSFEDACQSIKKWVAHIKETEAPDVMVVCYHGGFECDLSTGEPTEACTGENQGYQICEMVKGIDILITGHQHRYLADVVNGVTVIQPGSNGQALGEIVVTYDEEKIDSISTAIHYVGEQTTIDTQTREVIAEEEREVQQFLDQTIATVEGDMEIQDPMVVRKQGHPFINYINALQMRVSNAPISCTALFHDQSPGFPKQITMRDIVANYIYPNTLKVLRVTGQDIKAALEKSATYFTLENEKIAVNPDFLNPKPQPYNYDMWQGIDYQIKVSKPIGDRVVKLTYQGEPLALDQYYHVVMNNYRASGGGDYQMFQQKEVVKDIPVDMTELITDDLVKQGMIRPDPTKHFEILR
ncbi:bifunctional metallophosphatase/5'-nucleotidase [Gracilibacillus caseinilyticus]|uniref:Bifunctional metallophosphatase/5'-nucleotidase n=1 Tax=Gracilibacillus caseinilyticus TaxID=2932256 RepID=A0ABY4F1R7_9BACI|nr:bifunctional UDP-sugar hydrolase/5'-nucleotidase [Gracilibacillus caseinilyticus]UOQ50112.1 bifunctional metallophosphatase/5'-nucleotidase [Gracilibacillus caseinilyticus]